MSISEQVKELRELANSKEFEMHEPVTYGFYRKIKSKLFKAADTIETLSAKLQAANMERSDRYYGGFIDKDKFIEDLIPVLNEHGDMYLTGRIIGLVDSQPMIAIKKNEICKDFRCPNREPQRS